MADSIRATPQNATLGAIADLLKRTYAPQRTQQMQGIMEFLGAPAVARTLERLSYGQPVTNAGKANVPLLPDDTAEAAMVLAPPLGSLARRVGTNLVQTAPYVARDIAQSMSSPLRSNVVKPKGGNWLAGSVEQAVGPMKQTVREPEFMRRIAQDEARGLAPEGMLESAHNQNVRAEAINRWLDTKLSKYIRNEMGTPEDPLRALAERGVVHAEVAPVDTYGVAHLGQRRTAMGFPAEGMGQSEQARAWEAAADDLIHNLPAGERINVNTFGEDAAVKALKENPWLAKVPPETQTYGVYSNILEGQTQFGHLIDELKNAMDPNSGLPAALRLDPKDIDKVTVPQAVERVAKINAWRAAQKAEADMARAMNPATQVFKEYPEQGYKWVELKMPDRFPDEAAKEEFGDLTRYGSAKLADALKYEGETMGHCVGGYCPDVLEGRSRIFSLRDKKGQPHVTVEVNPGRLVNWDDVTAAVGKERAAELWKEYDALGGYESPDAEKLFYSLMRDRGVQPAPSIIQIKGKANRAPKEEYLPFVQDFVRSGKWSDVGDIHNTGMRATGDIFSEAELQKLRDLGQTDIPHILTGEEIQKYHNMIVPEGQRLKYDSRGNIVGLEGAEGFAAGGIVGLHAKYQAGGRVRPGEGLPEPSLLNFQLYADTVSREMFPGERDNAKRDAARHLIASALAAQKTSPGVAEFLGKAHEFKEAPLRTAGYWLGLTEPRADYHTDTHNNALGVALGRDKRGLREMLDAVEAATRAGTPQRQPGRVSLEPDADTRYAEGGLVAYDPEEINSIASRVREELHG